VFTSKANSVSSAAINSASSSARIFTSSAVNRLSRFIEP
jgi:hypothetical protein